MNPETDPNYEFGTYMTRRCLSYWEYCNGDCNNCYKNPSYTEPMRGYIFKYRKVQDTQGYPKYLFRRSNI